MSKVFVVDIQKQPLNPVHPGRARLLLSSGKAAVFKRFPFTIILKTSIESPEVSPLRLKIDPGSQTTGIAIVNDATGEVVFAAELGHRGQAIKKAIDQLRAVRRARRQRKTRYRAARFANRRRRVGWLPPSIASRVANVLTWVRRLSSLCPIGAISLELVKFDLQQMDNPEISGIEYQQGTLFGYEVRQYLLEKWHRACSYCGITEVPLQIEHIQAKANGGTDRVSNLCLACEPCNLAKGAQDIRAFLSDQPERLAHILAQAKTPLKDAAAVNSTRWLRFVCSKTVRTGRNSNGRCLSLTTDSSMMGAIPIPLGEERNSILPSVATGHQSEKREEMGHSGKLDVTTTPSKLLWLAQANLHINRRHAEQAKAS